VVSVNAAVTDPLTGLYNRRYLESHFERICGRLKDEGKAISLLMLDIDHFKKVNDTYGHDAGDQVLHSVAKKVVSNLRGFDTAVRFGGEEFVILLPDAPLSAAVNTAERLCNSIAATPVAVPNGAAPISITASLGVATMMAGEELLEQLLHRADAALYQAKESGRNRVISSVVDDKMEAHQQSAVG
jgi:two-component system cell cycle response regulator